MIVLAWIVVLLVALFAGASYWSVARAPTDLRRMLRDPADLAIIFDSVGEAALREEAKTIKPVFGSYANNIATFERIHMTSFGQAGCFSAGVAVVDIVASFFVSPWCLLATVAVLLLQALLPVPASVKVSNGTHLHTVLLNLIRWREEDAAACEEYCFHYRPDFAGLLGLADIVAVPKKKRKRRTAKGEG